MPEAALRMPCCSSRSVKRMLDRSRGFESRVDIAFQACNRAENTDLLSENCRSHLPTEQLRLYRTPAFQTVGSNSKKELSGLSFHRRPPPREAGSNPASPRFRGC